MATEAIGKCENLKTELQIARANSKDQEYPGNVIKMCKNFQLHTLIDFIYFV